MMVEKNRSGVITNPAESFLLSLEFCKSFKGEEAQGLKECGGVDHGWVAQPAVWCLPLAQGAILETRDRIPRRAPGAWSLLLPLPVSLPLSLSLSLCDYHK